MCISFFFFVQCCCHLLLNAIMLKLSFHISLQKFCSLQLTFLVMTRCKIFLRKIPVSMDCFLLIHVLYKGELRKERAKQFCSYIIMNYIAFFFFFSFGIQVSAWTLDLTLGGKKKICQELLHALFQLLVTVAILYF